MAEKDDTIAALRAKLAASPAGKGAPSGGLPIEKFAVRVPAQPLPAVSAVAEPWRAAKALPGRAIPVCERSDAGPRTAMVPRS